MPKRTPFEQQIADSREGNGVIRAGVNVGISLLQMIEEDLVQAWLTFWKVEAEEKALDAKLNGVASEELNKLIDKRVMIRGRVRGIAMCLATVRSPYSRAELSGSSKEWARVIIAQEKEGEARARLRRATG